jgi:signal transduction histidine kinase
VVTEKTYKWLSKAYEKTNDFQKALYYIELSNSLQDSINSIAIQKNIIRMQIKYDLETKENEIVLLHQQQRINALELKKQKTANLLMLVGIVLILTTMIFLIYYVHIRNQKNRILEEKNREIEKAQIELKKYSEDLLVAKQQAEKSSRAKSEFLANMSHEFRTPLNSVIGFTELILAGETDSDKKEKLKLIQSSSKSLLVLLTDILDLSKVEAGKLKIELQPVDVVRVVDEVYQMFKINTEKKGIRFEYSVQDKFPGNIMLSELRLRQILLNLIGNAVKFTQSGEIHIEVNYEEVTDNNKVNFCIRIKYR